MAEQVRDIAICDVVTHPSHSLDGVVSLYNNTLQSLSDVEEALKTMSIADKLPAPWYHNDNNKQLYWFPGHSLGVNNAAECSAV